MENSEELSGLIRKGFTSQRSAVLVAQSEEQPYSNLTSFAEAGNLRSLIFVTGRKPTNTQTAKQLIKWLFSTLQAILRV